MLFVTPTLLCRLPSCLPRCQFRRQILTLSSKAIGNLQVPIIWGNARASTFNMLVVPGLAWPILFGQNHLRMLQAHTDHARLRVRFDHPSLKFTITCCDENPFVAFPSLANQNSSQPKGLCILVTLVSSHPPVYLPSCRHPPSLRNVLPYTEALTLLVFVFFWPLRWWVLPS